MDQNQNMDQNQDFEAQQQPESQNFPQPEDNKGGNQGVIIGGIMAILLIIIIIVAIVFASNREDDEVNDSEENSSSMMSSSLISSSEESSSSESSENLEDTVETPTGDVFSASNNILENLIDADDFTQAVAAVELAGLVDALSSEGTPITIFLPVNSAFEALPTETTDFLLSPEGNQDLISILQYHIVSGEVFSTDLSDGLTVTSLQGSELTFAITDDGIATVNGANITTVDLPNSNGVVHVIDQVLTPPSAE